MNCTFVPITMEHVTKISSWRYSGFMKSIYMTPYFENYNPTTGTTKGPADCKGYAVFQENTLCGLYEYYFYDGIMEIGLALHPDFVGKGYSKDFILKGIHFGVETFHYDKPYVQLHVEVENKAAYYAYIKAGFKEIETLENEILMYYYLN